MTEPSENADIATHPDLQQETLAMAFHVHSHEEPKLPGILRFGAEEFILIEPCQQDGFEVAFDIHASLTDMETAHAVLSAVVLGLEKRLKAQDPDVELTDFTGPNLEVELLESLNENPGEL